MTVKRGICYVLLALLGLAVVITAVVATADTNDNGLRWFNEEFWASLTITFFSVAVSIGATVAISWWLLNKQLAAQREADAQARRDQLDDIKAEVGRDRRIRSTGNLREELKSLSTALPLNQVNIFKNPLNSKIRRSFQHQSYEALNALEAHEYRYARSQSMFQAITWITGCARQLMLCAKVVESSDAEEIEKWRAWGQFISNEMFLISEQIMTWQETDKVDLMHVESIDRLLAQLEKYKV